VLGTVVLVALAWPVPVSGAAGVRFTELFESAVWYERWGLDVAPWHTERMTDPMSDNHFLRVSFDLREFNGSSWKYPTGSADDVTLAYRVRFGPTWRPMIGSGGKLPGFGLPRYDQYGHCAEGCGLKPITGPHYSARASFEQTNTGGSYVYTPACGDKPRLTGLNNRWGGLPFVNGRWYTVRQRIVMNTPGVHDGRIEAWVDDRLVYDSGPAFCFRSAEHPNVHVGNAWFEMYYGGKTPTPLPMWLDLDDIRISF
jgi:hypothetical protein